MFYVKTRPILILTSDPDPHTDAIAKHLKEEDIPYVRLNSNKLGKESHIKYESLHHTYSVIHLGVTYQLSQFRSILYRKPDYWWDDHRALSPEEGLALTYKFQETMGIIRNMLLEAEKLNIFMVSSYSSFYRASNKLLQLKYATECGFVVPRTLATSDPSEASAFFKRKIPLVSKSINAANVYYGKHSMSMITDSYNAEEMSKRFPSPDYPILIQEEIPKKFELRITVVGDRIYACSIDSQSSDSSKLDWRVRDPKFMKHEPYELPIRTANACIKLCRMLGLQYAAIDMAVTPQGEYIFFEINPNGQYYWVEQYTGLPISKAIAALLIR